MSKSLQLILKALSDETRLQVVKYLSDKGSATCKELSQKFPDLTQPTMSHHFKILRDVDIIDVTKMATENLYTLNKSKLKGMGIDVNKF